MGAPLPVRETDPTLQRAVSGDRLALKSVAEASWPRMRRWAYLELGDAVLAEDAVQEALVRLVRFIGRYDPSRPFDPWLRTLVRNACRDVAGRSARNARREVPGSLDVAGPSTAERQLDLLRLARQALSAFRGLSGRQRQLLELVDRGGMTPSEAASVLGITPSAARSQLVGARRRVRTTLLTRGGPEILQLLREP